MRGASGAVARPFPILAALYRATDLSLNITSCQMPLAVNVSTRGVRPFPADRPTARPRELFAPDDLATYADAAELEEKVAFYRSHETERRRVAAAAQKRVHGEHTCARRFEKILELLRG